MSIFLAILLTLADPQPGRMETVRVADDHRGFVLAPSGQKFTPWGLNYGNAGRLIEDFWETDWPTVAHDFEAMKGMGANVARVHLQFGKFMDTAAQPNQKALDRLGRLVELAEKTGLYLDLTGLACYRKADVPPWYDSLSESDRWSAQAVFWGAVAKVCAPSPAIFCYDLMNEPLSGGDRKPGEWYSGKLFGSYDFLQWITLENRNRPREEIARLWIKRLSAAIHEHDKRHLITVGLLPWMPDWGHLSGFIPKTVAPELDFVSVHIYPEKGKVDQALLGLKKFDVGKPVVIEETFPLSCPPSDLEDFIKRSRPNASGWMQHYDGASLDQLKALQTKGTITLPQSIYLEGLALFQKLSPK